MRALWLRVGRRVRAEDGVALILAVVVVMVVAIIAVATASLVTSAQTTSSNERQGVRAFTAGEAGLDLGANAVFAAWNGSATLPADGQQLTGSSTVDGNTVNWTAAYVAGGAGAPGTWKVISTAVSPNGKAKRWLQQTLEPETATLTGNPSAIYGYGFVAAGSPTPNATSAVCSASPQRATKIGGSAQIMVPTWIEGDVCAQGGSDPAIGNPSSGSAIPVHIGGALFVSGNSWAVGTPTSKVASALILGGCRPSFLGYNPTPCSNNTQNGNNGGSAVYANDYAPVEPSPAPTKPTYDAAVESGLYSSASPGPMHPCTTGSTGSTFSFDSTGSTTADHSLGSIASFKTFLGTSAWDCQTASGHLAWTPGTPSGWTGTLLVSGTVFIDAASMNIGSNTYILLAGRGSIYTHGTLTMSNDGRLCGVQGSGTNCDFTNWTPDTDPSDPLVFFGAYNYANSQYGIQLGGNNQFQGIAFTNGGFQLPNGSTFGGSVFTDYGTVTGSGKFGLTTNPPEGALGGTTTTTVSTWSVAPRTWRQCPSAVGCT